jgi:hypothetical protein
VPKYDECCYQAVAVHAVFSPVLHEFVALEHAIKSVMTEVLQWKSRDRRQAHTKRYLPLSGSASLDGTAQFARAAAIRWSDGDFA